MDLDEFEAMTADLSEGGLSLVTEKNIPVGQEVIIKFSVNNEMGNTLSSHRRIIAFTGTLVHKNITENNLFRLGIYFGPTNPGNEDKFADIICSPVYLWPSRSRDGDLAVNFSRERIPSLSKQNAKMQ